MARHWRTMIGVPKSVYTKGHPKQRSEREQNSLGMLMVCEGRADQSAQCFVSNGIADNCDQKNEQLCSMHSLRQSCYGFLRTANCLRWQQRTLARRLAPWQIIFTLRTSESFAMPRFSNHRERSVTNGILQSILSATLFLRFVGFLVVD